MTATLGSAYDSPTGFRLADMSSVQADLMRVIKYCELILAQYPNPDDDLLEALQTAAVVTYVRAFASGKRSRFEFKPKLFIKDPGAKLADASVKDLRDKYVAHSVNGLEQLGVTLVFDVAGDGTIVSVVGAQASITRVTRLSEAYFDDFMRLASELVQELDALLALEEQLVLSSVAAGDYVGKKLEECTPTVRLDLTVDLKTARPRPRTQ